MRNHHNFRVQIKWFMNEEIESTIKNLETGIISRDQAIGSLNTVFRIASKIEDSNYMGKICRIISHIRSSTNYFRLFKVYQKAFMEDEIQKAKEM
ncbi:hypothetical protein [Paenibacillus rigui]|uniref:Uncharacterized protein n=1 Tax=Paenibacillus rigui TaxID=554312 RepID=A0A229UR23_9BACL|nr:hypothetical protein [Paenibacillus rigui]OXM85946.1 hypothetical protein CF651_12000 [Paenibacillus rigui]